MYYNSKTSLCQEFMYNFLLSNNGVLSVLEEEAGGGGVGTYTREGCCV